MAENPESGPPPWPKQCPEGTPASRCSAPPLLRDSRWRPGAGWATGADTGPARWDGVDRDGRLCPLRHSGCAVPSGTHGGAVAASRQAPLRAHRPCEAVTARCGSHGHRSRTSLPAPSATCAALSARGPAVVSPHPTPPLTTRHQIFTKWCGLATSP